MIYIIFKGEYMRITFQQPTARALGQQVEEFTRHFLKLSTTQDIDGAALQEVENRFHTLDAKGQIKEFAIPLWKIFSRFMPDRFDIENSLLPQAKGPVLAGVKEAPDLIYESGISDEGFSINALGYYKGGLASNTAHALRLQDVYAHFVPLLGEGEKANLHRRAIAASGIDLRREVRSKGVDAYTHFCSLHGSGNTKQENWMAQYRIPFTRKTIENFTAAIESALKENQGEVLVLSAMPPAGSGDDYFSRLTTLAKEYNCPTAFNSKQYDPMRPSVEKLFKQGDVKLIKPNLVEFVKFLRYQRLLHEDSDTAESEIYHRLKTQISKKNFKETFETARALINNINPEMIILLSFSEHGAMAINKDHAVVFGAPKIELGCSSGAGDSGLAGTLKTIKDQNINLWNTLKENELAALLESFIWSASATASLEGNNIAGTAEIERLKSGQRLVQLSI